MKTRVINGGLFVDDRGTLSFSNDFNFENVKRFYQIENHENKTIRAWHGHTSEGKYVYVSRGSILIGAVQICEDDIEIHSTNVEKFVLSSKSPKVLWIPPGYANGFMNLEKDTIVMFYSTSTLEDSKMDDIRFPYNKWDIWNIENR